MREIKFRAWDKINKVWISTAQFAIMGDGSTKTWGVYSHIIPMQYTGLKDKNGKEIYAGDIVECGRNGKKSYVEWLDEGACFIFRDKSGDDWWCPNCYAVSYSYYCIGNIYENPDLLA